MTVRELIAELSKYPPDANVTLETCDNSVDINHVAFAGRVQIFGDGWDDLPEDDDDDDDDDDEYPDEEGWESSGKGLDADDYGDE
jgi:regulator of RNase E activity RraB